MSSQAPCWANFGKAEGTPQLKLALQLVTKMPLHFKFRTKQEIIISFYFWLRILNATWYMATSKRLFCCFLGKQTTVTTLFWKLVFGAGIKKSFLLAQLPLQHKHYLPFAVNDSKWSVLLQLISMEQKRCPLGGHSYAASFHYRLLDYSLVQNINIKTFEGTNICSDINTAQPP